MAKKKKRQVAIIHYNTPELTEAAVLSLRKHGGQDYAVTIFDNSDRRPFTKKMPGVRVIDNTRGQYIDFDKELEKFPNRIERQGCAKGCTFGSAKHMMCVQWLWDNELRDGFLLMDSDVLILKNLDFMFDDDECCVGYVQKWIKSANPCKIDRLVPLLLWINVPMCEAGGARFYDPERSFALVGGNPYARSNWYDTGASFLEDIRTKKPACHGVTLARNVYLSLFIHYGSASWKNNDQAAHVEWLEKNRELWEPEQGGVLEAPEVTPKPRKRAPRKPRAKS
jgi:hypothetical protein